MIYSLPSWTVYVKIASVSTASTSTQISHFLTQSCGSHFISGKGNHVLADLQTWHLHLFLIYFCCGCHRLAFMCLVWKCVVLIELTLSQQAVVMALQLFDITKSHVWKHRGQRGVLFTVTGLEKMFTPFDRVISLNMTWDVKVQLARHTCSHSYTCTYTHAHLYSHTCSHMEGWAYNRSDWDALFCALICVTRKERCCLWCAEEWTVLVG